MHNSHPIKIKKLKSYGFLHFGVLLALLVLIISIMIFIFIYHRILYIKSAPTSSGNATVARNYPGHWSVNKLYVQLHTQPTVQAAAWASSQPSDAAVMRRLAAQPQAVWFGSWNKNVFLSVSNYVHAAYAANAMPVMVLYHLPKLDCNAYSKGGAVSDSAYLDWIRDVASAIRHEPAVIILEPDGLGITKCLSDTQLAARYYDINQAIKLLKAQGAYIYLDISYWLPASNAAKAFTIAGGSEATGFALNTSNFQTTSSMVSYGRKLSALTGGKHFVIDTSRNGNGPYANVWCNPPGRALGHVPTANTGQSLVDAYLWIKTPGQSDGKCNGGKAAGSWWPQYALQLAKRAGW